jgi:hypothetical protein
MDAIEPAVPTLRLEVSPPPPSHIATVMLDEFNDVFEGCGYDAGEYL